MNELTSGEQPVANAEPSEEVRIAEAAARAAEAEARIAEARATSDSSSILSRWEAITVILVTLLIVAALVLNKMVETGVFR